MSRNAEIAEELLTGPAWTRDLDAAVLDGMEKEAWQSLWHRITALCAANTRVLVADGVELGLSFWWDRVMGYAHRREYCVYADKVNSSVVWENPPRALHVPTHGPESAWQYICQNLPIQFTNPYVSRRRSASETAHRVTAADQLPASIRPGPEEALRVFMVNPTEDNLASLAKVMGVAPPPLAEMATPGARLRLRQIRSLIAPKPGWRPTWGDDVEWLLGYIDGLHSRLRYGQSQIERLGDQIKAAVQQGRDEEMERRQSNGAHWSGVPLPGDVCGHNRCVGQLIATETPGYVRCDTCAVRLGPGPGADETIEAAIQLGRSAAHKEFSSGPQPRRWYVVTAQSGIDAFDTEKDARDAAAAEIEYGRDEDHWPEEMGQVEWGELLPHQVVAETEYTETPDGEHDYTCDYVLQDAVSELRAELQRLREENQQLKDARARGI